MGLAQFHIEVRERQECEKRAIIRVSHIERERERERSVTVSIKSTWKQVGGQNLFCFPEHRGECVGPPSIAF